VPRELLYRDIARGTEDLSVFPQPCSQVVRCSSSLSRGRHRAHHWKANEHRVTAISRVWLMSSVEVYMREVSYC
jgi:hypothetical protein